MSVYLQSNQSTINSIHTPDTEKQKHEKSMTLQKVVGCALASVGTFFVLTGATVLISTLMPYSALAGAALTAFKAASLITTIAFSIFGLVKGLDAIAPKLPRSVGKGLNIIHAIITESFAVLGELALSMVNLQKRNPKNVEDNSQRPILMIHGLYQNSSNWVLYRNQLKADKVGPIFTINLGRPFASIDDHAQRVKEMVDEIQKITGRKDIMLVCHSMGGLVGAKFALDLASKGTQVTDLVTIGTPWEGTYVAPLGIGKSVKEMQHNSDYVKDLNERIGQTTMKRLYIASETDEIILPPSSAFNKCDVKAKRLTIPNLGHTGILFSDKIAKAIRDQYFDNIK